MAEFCTTLNQRISKIAFLLNQKEKVFLKNVHWKNSPKYIFWSSLFLPSPRGASFRPPRQARPDPPPAAEGWRRGSPSSILHIAQNKEGILWDCPIKRLEFLKKKTKLNTYSAMLWIRIRIPNLLLSWQFNSKLSSYGVSLFLSSFSNFFSSRIIVQINNCYREQIFLSDSNWVKFMEMDSNILWNNVLKF